MSQVVLTCTVVVLGSSLCGQSVDVRILAGKYLPLYQDSVDSIGVTAFQMAATPVTNAQYLQFVKANPQWQRSKIKPLFAEQAYLEHWSGDTVLGTKAPPNSPVVFVSWFAARAFCKWAGRRLPTIDEWEYAAAASEQRSNDYNNPNFREQLIRMYEKERPYPLPTVGGNSPNYWGLYDMHGLVWEWTDDFNSVLISGESRKDGSLDRNLFCAAGALGTPDPANYAAFLRYSFRGSLKADYCLKGLGFRTAKQ